MSVFQKNDISHLKKTMFFGESVDIQRFDQLKYPQFDQLTEKQLSFFWRPQEIDLSKDQKDFRSLSDHEQHIFTSNLKRQILLDSVQGRAPVQVFGPITSLPEIENWILTWTFSESIHSKSYTHIIRNIYSDPSKIFDELLDIPEIVDCAKDISKYYDELAIFNTQLADEPYTSTIVNPYQHKRALWMALNAVNALEGVRFYVSFGCSWSFAERKLMEGNAKIIKLICRDENLHLASTQKIINLLPQDDSDFEEIQKECEPEVVKLFQDVADQEKAWADYLFKDGSMIGLNADILKDYVEHITDKRMRSIGIPSIYPKAKTDPLPWTKKWIAGQDVQVAPQEVELSSYTIGEVNQDVNEDTFKNFEL